MAYLAKTSSQSLHHQSKKREVNFEELDVS